MALPKEGRKFKIIPVSVSNVCLLLPSLRLIKKTAEENLLSRVKPQKRSVLQLIFIPIIPRLAASLFSLLFLSYNITFSFHHPKPCIFTYQSL